MGSAQPAAEQREWSAEMRKIALSRMAIWAVAFSAGIGPVQAYAQPVPTENAAPAVETPDPARLAAAERVAGRIWPDGTWQRQLDSMSGGGFFSTLMSSAGEGATAMVADMSADIYGKNSKEARRAASPQAANAMASVTPNPGDMDRFFSAIMRAMGPIMAEIEPAMRAGIASSFARRFTLEQLVEIDTFFATPAGNAYAAQAMTMLTDPEIMQASLQIMPRMMESLPQIMEQVAQETGMPNPMEVQAAAVAEAAASSEEVGVNTGVKVE